MSIELVIQCPSSGGRSRSRRIPVQVVNADTTLTQVIDSAAAVATVDDETSLSLSSYSSIRYLQTTVHKSQWDTITLHNLGISCGDRVLFILETTATATNAPSTTTTTNDEVEDVIMTEDTITTTTTTTSTTTAFEELQKALTTILQSNFDVDSRTCVATLIKIIDNVLQKPNNPKVRSIRLSNPVIVEKIVTKHGVDYLLACGFVRQTTSPPLLAKNNEPGDVCLVLSEQYESTSHLIYARKLLAQTAIQQLHMKEEDLPKYKPPPPTVSLSSSSSSQEQRGRQHQAATAGTSTFNPYQRHRFNATGQPQPQSDSYVSTTETRLRQLQSKQAKLEAQLQGQGGPGLDSNNREVVAFRPGTASTAQESSSAATKTTTTTTSSDGALLAQRMQKLQRERKEREEGGFTTRAMRELQKLQQARVYSHVSLRIQFADGTVLQAKFLPRETVATVKQVIVDCMDKTKTCTTDSCLDFDLYVAPPRRKLVLERTLQEEGLVPAAKCFVSWKGSKGGALPPPNGVDLIQGDLFVTSGSAASSAAAATQSSFPTAKSVVSESSKAHAESAKSNDNQDKGSTSKTKKSKHQSKEDAMLARMMGRGSRK